LYQTCRYDFTGYNLPVPEGTYTVTLKFCEPHFDSSGKRVCDVTLQGKTVVKMLDIHGRVGKFAALDLIFKDVRVEGGALRIGLVAVTSLPCISAIVVEGEDFTRKINCGGPAWGGYEADAPAGGGSIPRMRKVACDDFYADWAAAMFGAEAGKAAAPIFARIDSRLPRPLARGCPAGVKPDPRPWAAVAPAYAFVDELAACGDKAAGAGNRERFDYWLGTMRYLRAGARLDCAVGKLLAVLKKTKAEKDAAKRKALAQSAAVPAYRDVLDAYAEAFGHLLDTASTKGGLTTIMYWEHAFHPYALERPGRELAKLLGGPLPADLQLNSAYHGKPRLIVPTVRTAIAPGETLTLKVLVLGAESPILRWRRMGEGEWRSVSLKHVARGAYEVAFPAGGAAFDLEYVVTAGNGALRFPAVHPQTLVLLPSTEESR
ncbi:hypothetical protein HQ560_04600, partial [bacterium]|nr:hypothetical protein [bacterium]